MVLRWTVVLLVMAVTWADEGEKTSLCELCSCTGNHANCHDIGLAALPKIMEADIGTTWIDFSQNNLTRITPFPEMVNLTYLSFKHNRISQIDAFSFYNLTQLKEIDLSYNKLDASSLKGATFKGPMNVLNGHESLNITILRLTGNEIHSLNSDVFKCLIYLEELYLDSNPMSQIDYSTSSVIGNLHMMKVLNLASTGIKEIPKSMLYTPLKLQSLNISANNFVEIPKRLEDARILRQLVLDGNPIKKIDSFPVMNTLLSLHLSWLPELTEIGDFAFSNLINLEEIFCTNNPYLVNISDRAFQIVPTNSTPQITYIPLKKLYLNDNRLGYINEELFERWELLDDLSLDANPWVCDCENQWFLVHLIPKLNFTHKRIGNLVCAQPDALKNQNMLDLARLNTHMRCLDIYGNHPEKDEKVLIFLLVATLFAVPIALIVVGYMKRPNALSSYYPKAVYRKAVSEESFSAY